MQLEFKINNPITIFNSLEIYRQIICSESGLSRFLGFNIYGFCAESSSNNFKIESSLPCYQNTFLFSCLDYPRLKALLPLHYSGIKMNPNLFLMFNNFYSKLFIRKFYHGISYEYLCAKRLSIEDILRSPVDSLETTQYYIMKLPFVKDRKVKIENGTSVSFVGNTLEELAIMESRFCNIVNSEFIL